MALPSACLSLLLQVPPQPVFQLVENLIEEEDRAFVFLLLSTRISASCLDVAGSILGYLFPSRFSSSPLPKLGVGGGR